MNMVCVHDQHSTIDVKTRSGVDAGLQFISLGRLASTASMNLKQLFTVSFLSSVKFISG